MNQKEFKELTAKFHTKVQEKLRAQGYTAAVQLLPSGRTDVQRIVVGNEVYDVFNNGNIAQWQFVGTI